MKIKEGVLEPTQHGYKQTWLLTKEEAKAIPTWWNFDCHVLKESPHAMGMALSKFCTKCALMIPESGCIHNTKIN